MPPFGVLGARALSEGDAIGDPDVRLSVATDFFLEDGMLFLAQRASMVLAGVVLTGVFKGKFSALNKNQDYFLLLSPWDWLVG